MTPAPVSPHAPTVAAPTDAAPTDAADSPAGGTACSLPSERTSGIPTGLVDTPAVALLHDLETLVVADLVFEIAPPGDRKTIEIIVERDASLVLKAPHAVTIERAEQFVTAKRPWVYRKLADKDALTGPSIVKQFVEGEGFAYLGRSYRLTLTSSGDSAGVRLERGRFHLNASDAAGGAELMRRWYTDVGSKWLKRRIRPWASRMGEPEVSVEVRDLGFRWGSARHAIGPQHINIHWATLQLPPSLIDYILVHELAHLHETNHTPEFWSIVARLFPPYETHKTSLATTGKSIWLGSIAEPLPMHPQPIPAILNPTFTRTTKRHGEEQ